MAGSMTDITRRKQAETRLLHEAVHDPLTGLPNRLLFMDRLDLALRRYRRDPAKHFAVLFFDLDRFSQINEALGQPAGDERVAQALRPEAIRHQLVQRREALEHARVAPDGPGGLGRHHLHQRLF